MSQPKPNIVLITFDQTITRFIGCYGSEVAITPNIDRLSREGVQFNNAYTSCPICSPARMSLLTGKYVSDIHANDNTQDLPVEEPTHNHYLTLAGYDTVLAGKMHAIGPDQLHGYARRLNTDVYPADYNWLALCREEKSGPWSEAHPKPMALDYTKEGVGVRQWSLQLDYDEETLLKALEYLRLKRTQPSGSLNHPWPERDDTPFFLHVSFQHPHEPFHCLQEYWDLYEGKDIPIPQYPDNLKETYTAMDDDLNITGGCYSVDLKNPESLYHLHRSYYANLTYADANLGKVLKGLEDYGLADDTIVIFSNDHGDMLGHRGMIQKRTFYEYSASIPLIFRFPKNFTLGTPGTSCDDIVSIVDICPTMLELAGYTDYLPMDGVSLLPQLNGEHDADRFVFSENHSEGVRGTCFMVRKGNYKFNYIYQKETQLFDVEADPEEYNNLSGKPGFEAIEEELKALILSRFDPDKIDRELVESIRKRWVLKEAHDKMGGVQWAYQPFEDANRKYWRRG